MTIGVAVRAGSAVVFATDSRASVTLDHNGSTVTYDNAIKVWQIRGRHAIVMLAGVSHIGTVSIGDVLSAGQFAEPDATDEKVLEVLAGHLTKLIKEHYSKLEIDPEYWEAPELVVATVSSDDAEPRVWKIDLDGDRYVTRQQDDRAIIMIGSFADVDSLLLGADGPLMEGLPQRLSKELTDTLRGNIADSTLGRLVITETMLAKALRSAGRHPMSKLQDFAPSMPLRDAVALAAFLVNVQIQMDRFLPDQRFCGGAVDVMVLQSKPIPSVTSLPGKTLRHPFDDA